MPTMLDRIGAACPGQGMIGDVTALSHPWQALSAMLLVQVLVAMANAAAPVLAPAVAPGLGLAPERIGLYAAVSYLCAAFTGLNAGEGVARLGAVRLNQLALAACAAGALLAALAPASWLLLAAALVGAGYGLVNPAAAAVLAHHAPARARGVFFSIKQTGVPIGVGLAGALLPLGLVLLGWQGSVVALAGVCVLVLIALLPLVERLEPPEPALPRARERVGALLARVWASPVLRAMCLASMAYAVTQQVYVTFLVSWLHLEQGWSLAGAAGVLAGSQLLSVAARIGFGAWGDRAGDAGRVLVRVGATMAIGLLALAGVAAMGAQAPRAAAIGAALLCAATAMGWNGLFLGALAQRVSSEDLARVSGATQFYTFVGGMLGPLAFGEAVRLGAAWGAVYAAFALVPAAAAWWLARVLSARRSPPA
ncbi:MAG: MFS transporter [Rubrivivax sp.]